MRRQITHINVRQTSKVLALLYGAIGVIVLLLALLSVLMGGAKGGAAGFGAPEMILLALPLLYAGLIWLATAFLAWLYNQIAAHVGGVEFESVDVDAVVAKS